MGSLGMTPPHGAYDRKERDVQLSPRPSRGGPEEGSSRTLPPISDLLPEMNPSNRSYSGRSEHSPPYSQHRLTPPTSSRPSPTNPSFSDRHSSSSRREEQPLPIHSGPPASDRPPQHLSASGWSDRRPLSNVSPGPSYATHQTSPYSSSAPGPRTREEEHRSGLPPPPPSQHYSPREPGRDPYAYSRSGDYDRGSWQEAPRPQYAHYPPSRHYDPHMPPPGPHGPPAYSPGEVITPHYSQLAPMGYEGAADGNRKRRGNLPRWITDLLKAWFLEHIAHPYPSEQEKNELCMQTGCSMTQISNWFINARRRRTPELTRQAEAERRLRDHAGRSSSNSE